MTIREKVQSIIASDTYTFCGIKFTLFNDDYIKVFDKVDGNCIFSSTIYNIHNLNNTDLLDKEYKKEELIKLSKEGSHTPFAICFYLEAPENIEGPISARVKYI